MAGNRAADIGETLVAKNAKRQIIGHFLFLFWKCDIVWRGDREIFLGRPGAA